MPVLVATHDGPFHADDVMALALIRTFHDPQADVVRTRDPARIDNADIVVDVGGTYDPTSGRFDHHQASYEGPLSAAGMVLTWLADTQQLDPVLARSLRADLMDYLDDIDNGRRAPASDVPCFPRIVQAFNHPARDHAEFDAQYLRAVSFAEIWLQGLVAEHLRIQEAERVVVQAMAASAAAGSRLIVLEEYLRWKPVYFANGGETHPTQFVLHPGTDGSWRVVAIPPKLGDFGQKRSLPAEWAGLTDEALEAVTGVRGAVFCHKNLFIAVFKTREAALEALDRHGLT